MKNALIIFTRVPVAGKTKTRLQPFLSGEECASLHQCFITDIMNKMKQTSADLFVLPTREDIWGLVINEAMSNGLPIISTNRCIAGLELVKDGENGFIVPVDDVDALSQKIETILSNEQILETMGKKSLEKIKDYTFEQMAKRHMEIFQSKI